jgi:hypothetical protein
VVRLNDGGRVAMDSALAVSRNVHRLSALHFEYGVIQPPPKFRVVPDHVEGVIDYNYGRVPSHVVNSYFVLE